jgi:hypothetical protein
MTDRFALDSPLNPYESPRGIGEVRDIRENGIGVWQDRGLIVMHERARLPPRCVKSGERADGAFPILMNGKELRVPLSSECFFWFVIFWRRLAIVALGMILVAAGIGLTFRSFLWELLGVVAVIAIAGVGLGWVALIAPTGLLRCSKQEHEYLWLSGAHPAYLSQLPPWPAG